MPKEGRWPKGRCRSTSKASSSRNRASPRTALQEPSGALSEDRKGSTGALPRACDFACLLQNRKRRDLVGKSLEQYISAGMGELELGMNLSCIPFVWSREGFRGANLCRASSEDRPQTDQRSGMPIAASRSHPFRRSPAPVNPSCGPQAAIPSRPMNAAGTRLHSLGWGARSKTKRACSRSALKGERIARACSSRSLPVGPGTPACAVRQIRFVGTPKQEQRVCVGLLYNNL